MKKQKKIIHLKWKRLIWERKNWKQLQKEKKPKQNIKKKFRAKARNVDYYGEADAAAATESTESASYAYSTTTAAEPNTNGTDG